MYSGVDFPPSRSASPTSIAPLPYWLGNGPNSHAIPSSLPCSSTSQSFPAVQSSTPMNHHHSYSTPAAAPIPPQEPAELLPIINPLLIDNLAKDFNLTSNQKSYLHAFVKVCNNPIFYPHTELADMTTHSLGQLTADCLKQICPPGCSAWQSTLICTINPRPSMMRTIQTQCGECFETYRSGLSRTLA